MTALSVADIIPRPAACPRAAFDPFHRLIIPCGACASVAAARGQAAAPSPGRNIAPRNRGRHRREPATMSGRCEIAPSRRAGESAGTRTLRSGSLSLSVRSSYRGPGERAEDSQLTRSLTVAALSIRYSLSIPNSAFRETAATHSGSLRPLPFSLRPIVRALAHQSPGRAGG